MSWTRVQASPSACAGVAQSEEQPLAGICGAARFVSARLQVQILSPAPECECGAAASIPGFQPGDTSSSLVFRSKSCGCDVAASI